MGCMLFSTDLRLSTDGLYTVGCPSNGRRASSVFALPAPAAQTSTGGTACSLLPAAGCAAAQASRPHRTPIAGLAIPLLTHTCCYSPATVDCLLPPPRGRLCCRAGLTAPPYSHCWPSHPSTHPHMLLFSGDGRRTSKPSYSRTRLRVGNNCRVFPASVSFPS